MVHDSMRIRTRIVAGGAHSDLAFRGVLMMWEIGYLPLRRVVWRPRLRVSAARRRREIVSQLSVALGRNSVGHLADGVGADGSPATRWTRPARSVGVHVEELERVEHDRVVIDHRVEASHHQVER